ncbi:MAG: hypothetical protein Pg6B_07410 [Candidatus Azobacteroides pseudotrichonymphae]|jgi:hypothetical protein|nr:MAG: hypothetical protein Pg6B_07410 [Candidatus Azobacteroides pseudotrichonymphae]
MQNLHRGGPYDISRLALMKKEKSYTNLVI